MTLIFFLVLNFFNLLVIIFILIFNICTSLVEIIFSSDFFNFVLLDSYGEFCLVDFSRNFSHWTPEDSIYFDHVFFSYDGGSEGSSSSSSSGSSGSSRVIREFEPVMENSTIIPTHDIVVLKEYFRNDDTVGTRLCTVHVAHEWVTDRGEAYCAGTMTNTLSTWSLSRDEAELVLDPTPQPLAIGEVDWVAFREDSIVTSDYRTLSEEIETQIPQDKKVWLYADARRSE